MSEPIDPRVYDWPEVRVCLREDLRDGEWVLQPRLDCTRVVERISPGVSEATFLHECGRILHPGSTEYESIMPLDVLGQFVRVDLLTPPEPPAEGEEPPAEPPEPVVAKSWVFRLVDDQRDVGKPATGVAQPITQWLTAVALEDDLGHAIITGGFVEDANADPDSEGAAFAVELMTPRVFNRQGRFGLTKFGNRCKDRVLVPGLPEGVEGRSAYVFDPRPRVDGSPTEVWSIADIVEYVIAFYVPGLDIDTSVVSYQDEDNSPMTEALGRMKPSQLSVDQMTVKQVLDELLGQQRGLAWRLRVKINEDDETTPYPLDQPVKLELYIFSRMSEDLVLSEATIPANENTVSLDAADPQVMDCRLSHSRDGVYDEVVAMGEPLLSCFTMAFADSTMLEDWSDTEEADYKTLANPDYVAGTETDAFLASFDLDQLQHVFCRYRLPFDWDGMAGDGIGGEKTLVNPKLGSDGELLTDAAPLNHLRAELEEMLPLESRYRPTDEDALKADARLYRRSFVLVSYPGDEGTESSRKYTYADAVPVESGYGQQRANVLCPPDRRAVQLQFEVPHLMGNSPAWTTVNEAVVPGATPAVFSYLENVATVALRTDQRLFCKRTPGTAGGRRLTISVPNAELWIVAPQTVTGVDASGGLLHYSGDRKVRDDSARLGDVASTAATRFGTLRQGLAARYAGARLAADIGQHVEAAVLVDAEPVNLPLSEIVYDMVSRTTTLQASRGDMDDIRETIGEPSARFAVAGLARE